MNIIPANAQHIGKRADQQDAFGFTDNCDQGFVSHSGFMAVLCDGMGGMALGEQASNQAVQTMLNTYMAKSADQPITEALDSALQAANQAVVELARGAGLAGEVGTTLAAAVIHKDKLSWVSVGDSRIYLVRSGNLIQITEDHNYSMELDKMVQQGRMSRQEAENDPERHALVSYLGLPELTYISASVRPMALIPGDAILLCSDGLYGSLTEAELQQVLKEQPNDPNALVQAVLHKELPHQDNITVAMLTYGAGVSDTLRTSPVQTRGHAGFWKRFGAVVIDGVITAIPNGILTMILAVPISISIPLAEEKVFAAYMVLGMLTSLITWLYYALMESSKYQGTLGKMALGIKVTDLYGRPVSFGRATGRYFGKIITSLIPLGIGYMVAGWTERKQAVHDMIAGCLVENK